MEGITSNMNMTSGDWFWEICSIAEAGDIDDLYRVIKKNPRVLDDVDLIPFINTPLHVAAFYGHLPFANEIMRLKPSFAWKLNEDGFTPIHLALQQKHYQMVRRFVLMNEDLVRAKGKEGYTPLHSTAENGEIALLIWFLRVCPESIEDVTIRSETALHIAVRCGQYEALQVLVGWLMRTSQTDALDLEKRILNWGDEDNNTILHVSSRENNRQMVQLLVKTKVDLKVKNNEERSALDIASNDEIRSILVRAGSFSDIVPKQTFADRLKSKMTLMDRMITFIYRKTSSITEEKRNAYLIIAVLIITTTYQFALSPPGGVYQPNAVDNNNALINATSLINSTSTQGKAGTSVLSGEEFFGLSYSNMLSFTFSIMVIPFMIQPGVFYLLYWPILCLIISYVISMKVISGNNDVLCYQLIPSAITAVFGVCAGAAFMTFEIGRIYSKQRAADEIYGR